MNWLVRRRHRMLDQLITQATNADILKFPNAWVGDSVIQAFGLVVILSTAKLVLGLYGIVIGALALALIFVVSHRLLKEYGVLVGWTIDFKQRAVFKRSARSLKWHDLDDDYSICLWSEVFPNAGNRVPPTMNSHVWRLELTHRRRGPVAELFNFSGPDTDKVFLLSTILADRLRLRKVGSGFPAKQL